MKMPLVQTRLQLFDDSAVPVVNVFNVIVKSKADEKGFALYSNLFNDQSCVINADSLIHAPHGTRRPPPTGVGALHRVASPDKLRQSIP